MAIVSVKIDPALIAGLDKLARTVNRSRSFLIREALARYLEDLADVLEAEKILLDSRKEDWVDHKNVEREILGH